MTITTNDHHRWFTPCWPARLAAKRFIILIAFQIESLIAREPVLDNEKKVEEKK